jgi:hypothetical protein
VKLTKAQRRLLEACLEFERGDNPRGLSSYVADRRSVPTAMQRGHLAYNMWVNEYVLTPQGRTALTETKL